MLFVVLCAGTPEGSTGSGSGFKASLKTGQRLKVSSDRLGEAGIRTCDPCLQDIGSSPTPRRLLKHNACVETSKVYEKLFKSSIRKLTFFI